MSKSSSPAPSHPTTHTQPSLLSDISASLAILAASLFLSFTLRYLFFEALFGVSLRSTRDIASFYLIYSAFILGLEFVSMVIGRGKAEKSKIICQATNSSLIRLVFLSTFHLITATFGATITLPELCHLAIWTLIAQLNQVICQIFSSNATIASFAFFGRTIEVMLLLGQGSRFLGVDPFDFL